MAHVIRVAVMKITRPQAKMEKMTSTRKIVPTIPPSVWLMISATGDEDFDRAVISPEARLSARRKAKPTIPLKSTENHMARGTTLWASCVSSARLAAASNTTMVKAPSRNESIKGLADVSHPREK